MWKGDGSSNSQAKIYNLKDLTQSTLPRRLGCYIRKKLIVFVVVEDATTGIEIHVACANIERPLFGADLPAEPEHDSDDSGKVALEEGCGVWFDANWPDGNVKFGDERKSNKDEAGPGSPNTERTSPGYLVEAAALCLPAVAETNVCQADTSTAEESGETGYGEQPVEELRADGWGFINEGKETEAQLDDRRPDWTSLGIQVGDEFWSHSLVRQCVHCSG